MTNKAATPAAATVPAAAAMPEEETEAAPSRAAAQAVAAVQQAAAPLRRARRRLGRRARGREGGASTGCGAGTRSPQTPPQPCQHATPMLPMPPPPPPTLPAARIRWCATCTAWPPAACSAWLTWTQRGASLPLLPRQPATSATAADRTLRCRRLETKRSALLPSLLHSECPCCPFFTSPPLAAAKQPLAAFHLFPLPVPRSRFVASSPPDCYPAPLPSIDPFRPLAPAACPRRNPIPRAPPPPPAHLHAPLHYHP